MIPKIICTAIAILLLPALLAAQWDESSYEEIQDLNTDLDAYMSYARITYDPADRHYLSNVAVQNIYKQKAIWRSAERKNELINDILSESLVKFIFVNYYLDNPNWVDWGFWNLETFYPSYTAYIDTSTDKTYGECMSFLKENWLASFAKCNSFNELVPAKKLEDNWISVNVRQGIHSNDDMYLINCAEDYINHWMSEHREWFTFFLPQGQYQLGDEQGWIFPKEFDAAVDSAQFIYFTPNYSFDFVPVAQVFADDGITYDTLSPTEFELVRINEGRLAEFESLEFGRYEFRVKPPYKIVDKYPNKLIIPKEAFGEDYMDKESTMFNKHAYDKVTVGNRQQLIYTKIERVVQPALTELDDDEKD
jgi:hypothetical protein